MQGTAALINGNYTRLPSNPQHCSMLQGRVAGAKPLDGARSRFWGIKHRKSGSRVYCRTRSANLERLRESMPVAPKVASRRESGSQFCSMDRAARASSQIGAHTRSVRDFRLCRHYGCSRPTLGNDPNRVPVAPKLASCQILGCLVCSTDRAAR